MARAHNSIARSLPVFSGTGQVPTVLETIEIARREARSPESIFVEFIARKVRELLA